MTGIHSSYGEQRRHGTAAALSRDVYSLARRVDSPTATSTASMWSRGDAIEQASSLSSHAEAYLIIAATAAPAAAAPAAPAAISAAAEAATPAASFASAFSRRSAHAVVRVKGLRLDDIGERVISCCSLCGDGALSRADCAAAVTGGVS